MRLFVGLASLALSSLLLTPASFAQSTAADPAAAPPAAPAEPAPVAEPVAPPPPLASRGRRTLEAVQGDYRRFYSPRNLVALGAGIVAAGVVANTDADQEAYDWYHEQVGDGADDAADAANHFGDTELALGGAVLGAALLGLVPKGSEENAGAAWVRRWARGYVVGLPALAYLQRLAGAGRPGEPGGSEWDIFGDSHGVSGHAFLGAVPFLTAARMTDNRFLKGVAIVASMATGWARVHDEDHYFSQAFLGWYLAWSSTGAVAGDGGPVLGSGAVAGVGGERGWEVMPLAAKGGGGVMVRTSF